VLGLDSRRDRMAIHRRITYLPGEVSLYGNLTGYQLLDYLGNLRGGVDRGEVNRLVERLQLDPTVRIRSLSRGNRQKVGLVAALMGKPDLLILDEPTTGLDPFVQLEFERLAHEAQAEGRTVFLSSHLLPEVEHLCDRVAIIREGRLLAVESIADLNARALRRRRIDFAEPVDPAAFTGLPGVRDVSITDGSLTCTVMGTLDALVKTAARFTVRDVSSQDTSLEEIFLAYYGEGTADAAA
jgi:ABC-2 type transport system ATP-binding protein